jgi:hypothetical protein
MAPQPVTAGRAEAVAVSPAVSSRCPPALPVLRHQTQLHAAGIRRRPHLHFTPTSSSWLNLVEVWFSLLTARRLKRGVFTSVDALQPFIWKKTANEIITKVKRGRATLTAVTKSATHH